MSARLGYLFFFSAIMIACGPLGEDEEVWDIGDGKADTFTLKRWSFELPPARSKTKPSYKTFKLSRATASELLVRTVQNTDVKRRLEIAVFADKEEVGRSREQRQVVISTEQAIHTYLDKNGVEQQVEYDRLVPSAPADSPLAEPRVKIAGHTRAIYSVKLYNYGEEPASGELLVGLRSPGVSVLFNTPECYNCDDRTGGMLDEIVQEIKFAQKSIDVAIYGLKEKHVLAALCQVAYAGMPVRLVGDYKSRNLEDSSRSYFPAFELLGSCGAKVEYRIDKAAIMHHKFYLIDKDTPYPVIATGSTNQTPDGFNRNHNHMVFIHTPPNELLDAYQAEFDQLFTHCKGNLSSRGDECTACTSACLSNVSAEGPFQVGDAQISVYFSPSDDALTVLRGPVETKKLDAVPAHCQGPDASCVCRGSGDQWSCDFCGGLQKPDRDGNFPPPPTQLDFGLINGPLADSSAAGHRVMMTMYAGTDQCFALAMGKVAARGGQTLAIWDNVNAGSKYTRDKYMCSLGIPTYVSRWANGDAQVRNHNKTIIVDDMVIDGSMNISSSGLDKNSENTLVIKSPRIAAKFATYIQSESELIETIVSALTDPEKVHYHLRLRSYASPEEVQASRERCMKIDLIDNDGDGLYDENDPDGDLGTQQP